MYDVLAVGDVNVDIITSRFRMSSLKQQVVEDIFMTKGGEAFNFACASSKLGMKTRFIGRTGKDIFGNFLKEKAVRYGINVPIQTKGRTGVTIAITEENDRKFVSFRGENGNLKYSDIKKPDLGNCKFFYLGGLWHLKSLQKHVPMLFKAARKYSTTCLNIGCDYEKKRGILADLLPYVDIFFLNDEELEQISMNAKEILGMGVKMVVVHKGHHGSELHTRRGKISCQAMAKKSATKNPTGAGDVSNAGFVFALLKGFSFREALSFCNACGALHVIREKDFVPAYRDVLGFWRRHA
jgi:2-dehydro-3-deoxygluconokinase